MRCARVIGMVVLALVMLGSGVSEPELSRLRPEDPRGYVELGVRSYAMGSDTKSAVLAKELLVRGAYYAAKEGDDALASSACMALLAMLEGEERELVRDLALVLDPSRLVEWAARGVVGSERGLDQRAIQCVSSIRYHDVSDAREVWAQREIKARVREAAERAGFDPGEVIRVLDQELQRAIDDPCRGRLYVVDRENRGQHRVCPNHLRGVGLSANDDRLSMMIEIEAQLAGARSGGWGEDGGGADLTIPRIEDLLRMTGVDVSRPFYRGGVWAE